MNTNPKLASWALLLGASIVTERVRERQGEGKERERNFVPLSGRRARAELNVL